MNSPFKYFAFISYFSILVLLHATTGFAQTQQGYVKTIGRPDKPGTFLSNVVIQAQGMVNPVISDSTGEFNISIPEKKDGDPIMILRIQKKGYELKDKEFINRQHVCSSRVPIIIQMIDQKQLAEDKQRIEANAYRVAEENYQKRLDELEKQKAEEDITAEKYRQELQGLQDKYEKYLSLVSDMADRYARTDYDELDSIDYQINLCIENGELDKADSLIHTVFDPETVLERNRAAKQEILDRIALAQNVIDKANADRKAIMQDMEYAKRLALMCESLAQEYILLDDKEKAIECLEKSKTIKTILHGEESEEIRIINEQIKEIMP